MTASGEMRATVPATLQDVHTAEERVTRKLKEYEETCERDRKAIKGEIDGLTVTVKRIEQKTDEGNTMIKPVAKMFKGIVAHPKVQTAVLGLILTLLGYLGYKIQELTHPQPQQNNPSVIIYPITTFDGGVK